VADGTPTERLLRATLWEFGIRYRTSEKVGGISPTLTIPAYSIVVFVSDCEAQRCPWDYPKRKSPKVWKAMNDFDTSLRKEGWIVIRVWQHDVDAMPRLIAGRVAQVVRAVQKVVEDKKR
jgi:G:T-mismatch repair DNA endonuclease (very short patch repair protein)